MSYLSLSLMIAVSARPPAAAPPVVPPCVEEVSAQLQREDFAGVLLAAERCGALTAHPRTAYFAGVAHIGLGQHALAILKLQRYLGDDAPNEPKRLREVAETRLLQAKAQSIPVRLRITDSEGEDELRVTAEPDARGGEPVGVPLTSLEERDGDRVLWLDPGRYRITVDGSGQLTATQSLVVVTGAAEIVLNVSLKAPVAAAAPPPPPVPVFPRGTWFAVTGSAGGVNVLAGVSLLSLGWVRGRQFAPIASSCRPITGLDRCRGFAAEVTTQFGAGAGLLGAGLGVLASSFTALVKDPGRRKLVWRIEAGIGAGTLLAGAVLLGVGLRNFNRLNTDASSNALLWGEEYQDKISERANQYNAGAGLVGVGVGLAATAALGLLVQRLPHTKAAAAGRWQIEAHGLALRF